MPHLQRRMDALDHAAAAGDTVIDRGEAIEHGAPEPDGFLDAVLRFGIAVLPGVAVDRGGQKVGLAFLLQILHELDMLLDHRHTGARLNERPPRFLGLQKLCRKDTFRREPFLIISGLLQVYVLSRRPLAKDLLPFLHEDAFVQLFVLNFHLSDLPFHNLKRCKRIMRGKQPHCSENIRGIDQDLRVFRAQRCRIGGVIAEIRRDLAHTR